MVELTTNPHRNPNPKKSARALNMILLGNSTRLLVYNIPAVSIYLKFRWPVSASQGLVCPQLPLRYRASPRAESYLDPLRTKRAMKTKYNGICLDPKPQ